MLEHTAEPPVPIGVSELVNPVAPALKMEFVVQLAQLERTPPLVSVPVQICKLGPPADTMLVVRPVNKVAHVPNLVVP